jgi:hypothetical protein
MMTGINPVSAKVLFIELTYSFDPLWIEHQGTQGSRGGAPRCPGELDVFFTAGQSWSVSYDYWHVSYVLQTFCKG